MNIILFYYKALIKGPKKRAEAQLTIQ